MDADADTHTATRLTLQRVATHVLARARQQAVGRFGLRASPGGVATPAFGDDHAVVRIVVDRLVVERGATATHVPLTGSSLRQLASVAGVDLDAPLDVGRGTTPLGDLDAPLAVDARAALAIADWYAFGWRVLDDVVAAGGPGAQPSRVQLWPEHFDAGCDVAVGPGPDDRCNLGASPGDDFHPDPYLYVGPWAPERPGDDGYWNAPFGAALAAAELRAAVDPVAAGVAFMVHGLSLVRAPA